MITRVDGLMFRSTQETEGLSEEEIVSTLKAVVSQRAGLVKMVLKEVLGRSPIFDDTWLFDLEKDERESKGFRWVERLYFRKDGKYIFLGNLIMLHDSAMFEHTEEFKQISESNIKCVGCGPRVSQNRKQWSPDGVANGKRHGGSIRIIRDKNC